MLNKIDNLIENAKKHNSTERFLNTLSELVINYLEIDVSNKKYQSILKKELAQNKKRFIAFCLLRVYNINSKIVTDKSVNHSVISFLEQAVPDVFKKMKISPKTETWKKENLLESYVGNIEKDLNNKINIDVELSKIKSFKNAYLASINNPINKSLLSPFFGNINIKDLSEKAFNSLIKYFDSDNINKFKNYNLAIEKINSCIETSQEIDTKYINDYVVKPFSKFKAEITGDFENNPYARPAELEIKKTEKKYPIIPNVTNQIKLIIENLSTGYAYDTIIKINEVTNIKLANNEIFIGTIETSSIIKIDYVGQNKAKSFLLDGIIEWRDYDNKVNSKEFILELIGQNTSVDWEKLEKIEPYDLEPVTTEDEFIGRKQIINLLKNVKNKLKSSYVFGQRRVGKTSIVKTLQTSLMS